ncbi:LysE family transporter [uncultured Sulfitobacter sp.]|uniref:LysE family translocator n=1 Tax=uncultured Sulfitobacter sp. TaxID=191468 RepID=UPI00261A7B4E|nr:LysE family transporter [uncultured Sulfitobacter sp.]
MTLVEASWPLLVFVVAGLFSPGPNVVMLTASGARFGFRATVPHLLGVPVGTGLLAAASALGLGAVLLAMPALKLTFQIIAAGWILWLAWRIAQAARAGQATDRGRPFAFLQAVGFQAVNPKIWAVTLAAAAGFGIGLPPVQEALRLFVVFAGVNLCVCLFWTTAGHLLAPVLARPPVWRAFMVTMAVLLALTVILIFAG